MNHQQLSPAIDCVIGRRSVPTWTCIALALLFMPAVHAATLYEGAENGLANVTAHVSGNYELINSRVFADPSLHSFHFAQPDYTDQWILLNTPVVPQADSELRFQSMLRWATDGQVARAQISTNNGATWIDIYTQPGTVTAGEGSFSLRVVSLAAYAGSSIRVRFNYTNDGNGGFGQSIDSVGWFVDQIEVRSGGQAVLLEGAENGLSNITVHKSGSYEMISSAVYADATFHSFHFAHPDYTNQWIVINTSVVPQAGSELRFQSMLRWASDGQVARAQVSTDSGATWIDVYAQPGTISAGEANFSLRVVSLAAYAGRSIRIRFNYTNDGNGGFGQTYDSVGWFVDQIEVTNVVVAGLTGASFYTVPPCRVADTRDPAGAFGGPPLAASTDRTFVIAGRCGISIGAKSVAFNFAITQPSNGGYLRVFPAGVGLPLASSLNWAAGKTRANSAVIALGASGDITVHLDQPAGTVHLIIDTSGYLQ